MKTIDDEMQEFLDELGAVDPSTEDYLRVLLYSLPGVGKTVLAGTSAFVEQMSPVLVLSFDQSSISLVGIEGVKSIDIFDWEQAIDILENMDKLLEVFKTIVIDSVSSLVGVYRKWIIENKSDFNPRMPKHLTIPEHGSVFIQAQFFIDACKQLPCHVIFTCHSRSDEEGVIHPHVATESINEIVFNKLDNIFCLLRPDLDETRRVLYLDNESQVYTKCRLPYGVVSPEKIEDPTFEKIYNLLRN